MAVLVKETDKYFVLSAITKKHEASGGHNGLLFNDLASQVSIDTETLKETINQLCREKKISYHQNVHGLMFKLKK